MELNELYEATSNGVTHSLAEDPVGDFHYMMVSAEQMPITVVIPLDRDEMEVFKNLLETAAKLLSNLPAGGIVMVGELPPRPIVLGLNAVAPHNRPPFLLARLSQRTNKIIDFALGNQEDVGMIAGRIGVQLAGGNVNKTFDTSIESWNGAALETAHAEHVELVFAEGFSQCLGRFGEFRTRTELSVGDSVRVWPCHFEGGLRAERVQLLPLFEEEKHVSTSQESEAFNSIARQGEQADRWMHQGEYYRAFTVYEQLRDALLKSGKLDTFLAAKIVLSMVLCQARRGNTQEAAAIWTGHSDAFAKIGLQSLESGSVSVSDTLLYKEVECYLHSLGGNPGQALTAVNGTMEMLMKNLSTEEPERMPYLLSNWMIHLLEVFEGPPPEKARAQWNAWAQKVERPVEAKALYFRRPGPWVISWEAERPAPVEPKKPWWKRWLGG